MKKTFLGALLLAVVMAIPAMAKDPRGDFEVTSQDRTMGNAKAKVVLIEYAALSCPHCAAFNQEVLPLLKKNYIDTGKLLYVFRLFPRMPEDGIGEKLARCLPRAKYFPMIDTLFAAQQKWDPEFGVKDGPAQLGQLGLAAGLSKDRVNACAADPADNARINKNAQEAVDHYALTGTPTLVINGRALPSGGLEYRDLAKLLDKAAQARP